jgi:FdhE protein
VIAFSWDQRIRRAEQLIVEQPASLEFLRFYAQVARFQKDVFDRLKSHTANYDPALLGPYLQPFLRLVQEIGPPAIAEESARTERAGATFDDLLPDRGLFFTRALLQPYMECLVTRNSIPTETSGGSCPYCGDEAQAAVLRGEGDGAKRSLLCGLCSSEWVFRRLVCPRCGEEQNDRLPVYTASGMEHVRVEACDSCHGYIKSIDLTRNGLAVPSVDEIGAVALDLWAQDNGYEKISRNLLGM